MKVIVAPGARLNSLEHRVKEVLERESLIGYALMGFHFADTRTREAQEIDAVLFMEPGIFACLEVKDYGGCWSGYLDSLWKSNGTEIKSSGVNPWEQVTKAVIKVKTEISSVVRPEVSKYIFVSSFIVAPDSATIAVKDAVVNQIQKGKACQICNLTRLEALLRQLWSNQSSREEVRRLGMPNIIQSIVGPLQELATPPNDEALTTAILPTSISIASLSHGPSLVPPAEDLEGIQVEPHSEPRDLCVHDDHASLQPSECRLSESTNSSELPPSQITSTSSSVDGSPSTDLQVSSDTTHKNNNLKVPISVAAVASLLGFGSFFIWQHRPCETSADSRSWGVCYKDLRKMPLKIGVIADPSDYEVLASHLKDQMGDQVRSVTVDGGRALSYRQVQERLADRSWDIVFTLSPVNSLRAKDNGYIWLARMFPRLPATIQSAIFSRAGSKTLSLSDIGRTTKVALGDPNSSTSFYLPVYDLYGKTVTLSAGNKSSSIPDVRRQSG